VRVLVALKRGLQFFLMSKLGGSQWHCSPVVTN
jgi:hypothetical protein